MRRPAAEVNSVFSKSFGEVKLVRAAVKSYLVMTDDKLGKWPLLCEITEKHTANHRLAAEMLLQEIVVRMFGSHFPT